MNKPASIALDAEGNLWAANYYDAVTELSNTGEAISPASGFTGGGLYESYGIAVVGTEPSGSRTRSLPGSTAGMEA